MGRIPSGQGTAFEPRSVVRERGAFGKVSGLLEPADGIDPEGHRYRAAMMQHLLANTVREYLMYRDSSVPKHFEKAEGAEGFSADRQQRMMRGETMAQYADIAYWSAESPRVATVLAQYIASFVPAPDPPPSTQAAPPQAMARSRAQPPVR